MPVESPRDPASEIAALAPGTVFHGVYEVVRCIKAGGMGAVYEVLQKSTRRYRALKVMLPSLVSDPDARARFELEAKIAAGIESDHIVETMDAGIDQATGMPFIVMELLKGEELGKLLKEQRRLSPDDVVTYLHQAALALDRTHAAGIIHRDLKPENLFLTRRDDGSPRVKILDFGVAKIVAEGSVNANSTKTVGSPLYMGPEQISGEQKVGPAVDRYSLAHIAFTLLVGKAYWRVERKAAEGIYAYMMQLVKGARVPASERAATYGVTLPAAFDVWFVKATSIDPAKRHESAVLVIAELAQVFGIMAPVSQSMPPPRTPLPSVVVSSVSLPSSTSVVPTLAPPQSASPPEPADAAAVEERRAVPRQISANETVVSAIVRNDEPSLRPVTVTDPSRTWVAPASVLLVGFMGIAGARLILPEQRVQSAEQSSESVRTPLKAASSALPVVTSPRTVDVAPVVSSPAPASSNVASIVPSAIPVASALSSTTTPAASALPRPSATASSKPTRPKRNNVLDEY